MAESSAQSEGVRRRILALIALERELRAYLAVLEQAQAYDLAQIPPDLHARLDARASAIADIHRLLDTADGGEGRGTA